MFAYLFLIFVLFQLREYQVLAEKGIPYTSFGISLIKALVLGKVMLVADGLRLGHMSPNSPVCTENLIRVDDVMESPKLAE
jgi:hypothetical protein